MDPKYKRILLKLSGEGLMGDKSFGMSAEVIDALARQIKDVHDNGVEICVVVGGGNIFRGAKEASKGTNGGRSGRHAGDGYERPLCTKRFGENRRFGKGYVRHSYSGRMRRLHLPSGGAPFGKRTGHHFCRRHGKSLFHYGYRRRPAGIDGVYDSDPKQNEKARKFAEVTYDEVIARQLKVMDTAAVALARENNIPIVVFAQTGESSLADAVCGRGKFTIIKKEV